MGINMTKPKLRILLFFVVVSMMLPASFADSSFDKGVAAYKRNDFKTALASFAAVTAQAPGNASAYYYQALCQHRLGQYNAAKEAYRRVVQLAPGTQYERLAQTGLDTLTGRGTSSSHSLSGVQSVSQTSSADILPGQASFDFRENPNRSGYYDVEVMINNRTAPAIFDTGADRSTFSKNQLAALGIKPPSGPTEYNIGEPGTPGYTGCWKMFFDVRLGGIRRSHYPIEVQQLDGDWRSIGTDFFDGYKWSLDRGTHRVHCVSKAARSSATSSFGSEVPYKKVRNDYILSVDVNGRPCDFVFDTGGVSVWFSQKQAVQAGIKIPSDAETTYVGEQRCPAQIVYIQRMRLGPIEKANVEAFIYDEKQASWGTDHPILGPEFYKEYQYTIEPERGTIRFLRR